MENSDKLLELLKTHAEMLSKITTIPNLEKITDLMRDILIQINLQSVNPLVLNFICNNIVAKIILIIKNSKIPPNSMNLLELMMEEELIDEVYQKNIDYLYSKTLNSEYEIIKKKEVNLENKKEVNFRKNFNMNLDMILNLNYKTELNISKNFGYSLLDLNGDFIWMDENSEKFFEIGPKEFKKSNFFKLLIPFSKKVLKKRFCGNQDLDFVEIFGKNKNVGGKEIFSYVIYSKKSVHKYIKHCRKRTFEEIKELTKKSENLKDLFYKYLKALSSRASLIVLKFTPKEFRSYSNGGNFKLNYTYTLNKIFEKMREKKVENVEGDGDVNFTEDDFIYKVSILLETRFSKKIPNFDYSKMKDDKKILKFEDLVMKKIKKFC